MGIVTTIYAKNTIEGLHNWKNCPLEEVNYLKYPHRHQFIIESSKLVSHLDRDLEFFVLKHQIDNYFKERYYDDQYKLHVFNSMSCEMIALELLEHFNLVKCTVTEDGECGATVQRI